MYQSKEFFIYAYLVLLRGMLNNKNERRNFLNEIYDKERGGTELLGKMDAFMYKYGLNLKYLK